MNLEIERHAGELRALREQNAKLKSIIQHATAEKTGVFFVCGQGGAPDEHGLPTMIMVCPSFGLDGFAIYTKTSNYSAPQY